MTTTTTQAPRVAVLGERYRDSITEFEGTATCILEFLHGCRRITLTGTNKDDEPVEYTFDEPQLIEVVSAEIVEGDGRPGGDRPTAPRTGLR